MYRRPGTEDIDGQCSLASPDREHQKEKEKKPQKVNCVNLVSVYKHCSVFSILCEAQFSQQWQNVI